MKKELPKQFTQYNLKICIFECMCRHTHTCKERNGESEGEPAKKIISFLFSSELTLNNFSFLLQTSNQKKGQLLTHNTYTQYPLLPPLLK